MVKAYLRYEPSKTIGLISSNNCNVLLSPDSKYVLAPALASIYAWSLRSNTLLHEYVDADCNSEVTCMKMAPNKEYFAAGYFDGSIRIWEFGKKEAKITFHGHKNSVVCLEFDAESKILLSGGKDTDVVLWDLTNETGIARLKGHTDQITCLKFLDSETVVSSSKDCLIKLWDIESCHCFETLVSRSEVYCLELVLEKYIVSGGTEANLRIWEVNDRKGQMMAELKRESKERVVCIKLDHTKTFLAVQNNDKTLEIFKILSENEKQKRLARKKKRSREKGKEEIADLAFEDNFKSFVMVRAHAKIVSFDFSTTDSNYIVVGLADNSIEYFHIKDDSIERQNILEVQGHRSEIRTTSLSLDEELLLSASKESIKIWNIRTGNVIKSLDCGPSLCSLFVPGNKQVIIGTKNGTLELFDLSSSIMLESIKVHDGAIYSMSLSPDNRGIITGSADKTVKFFDFEWIQDPNFSTTIKRLTLVHSRTLELTDEVMAVKFSPNHKLIAVSCLDLTVKIFYVDSLKFYLSLYGHKLPVLALDISSDNTMLISASADKNIKIWGLDFGDCRKSMFAHTDSILSIKFIANTHYFLSSSRDKTIKYWDGDKFECICQIGKHFGDVWSLSVSRNGSFFVSGSADRTIKFWSRTEDQVFLEEEREKEIEESMEKTILEDQDPTVTKETLHSSEKLAEAIEFANQERLKMEEDGSDKYQLAALGATTRDEYLLKVIEKISLPDLENAVLLLPFGSVLQLLPFFETWIKNGWNIPLVSRILCYICRIYQPQIVSNEICKTAFESLKTNLRSKLSDLKDTVGFNLAALTFLRREWEMKNNAEFFGEAINTMNNEKVVVKRKLLTTSA